MTATRLASGSTSGVLPDWFNVMDYGAVGNDDGTGTTGTDDTTAFQNAINAAKAANGTVYVPGPHRYKLTSRLDCTGHSWRMTGSGSGGVGPMLVFTSTATLAYHSTYLFELDNLSFQGGTGFAGKLVEVDGAGALGGTGDCQQYHIHDCNFTGTAGTTAALLYLNKTVIGKIDNCRFAGSINHIKDGGTHFINSVTISDCVFNPSCTDAHIKFASGDIEMLRLIANTHEAGINTTAIKCATNARFYKPLISGCWFGDAGGATVIWIDGIATQSNRHVGTIRDNMFFLAGTVNDVGIKFGDVSGSNNCGNWLVEGNSFLGSGNAYDTYTPSGFGSTIEIANSYVSLTNVWKTGTTPLTAMSLAGDVGSHLLPSLVLTNTANPAQPSQSFQLGDVSAFSGTQSGVGFEFGPAFTNTACLKGIDEARLRVQGGNANGEIRVQANKIGEFGAAPAARPAAYTLNAGATSRNLPSGATVAQVEQVLRQLLTDFQTRGTLQ